MAPLGRVLVTGITGFVGSHLAEYVLAQQPGVEVAGEWHGMGLRGNASNPMSFDVGLPETHRLADRVTVSISEFSDDRFVTLPTDLGSVLNDRLRQMSREAGFSVDIVQDASDTWTLMSLVSAEVVCSLTLSSVIPSIADPHLRFLRLSDDVDPVELRIAWRADSDDRAMHAVLRLAEEVLPDIG